MKRLFTLLLMALALNAGGCTCLCQHLRCALTHWCCCDPCCNDCGSDPCSCDSCDCCDTGCDSYGTPSYSACGRHGCGEWYFGDCWRGGHDHCGRAGYYADHGRYCRVQGQPQLADGEYVTSERVITQPSSANTKKPVRRTSRPAPFNSR